MRLMSRVPRDSRTPVITTVVINQYCRECCVSVTKEPATEKRYGEEREVHRPSVCYKDENKRDQLTVPDGRYRTYCHIRIPVWRAVRIVRILDHNNVKWKTFTVVLG
ncbi:hypothetical protein ALC60_06099 [Trachymyrmex zeteki]|uniref:Uncharacterized protein n=1 Tax=Mycetomoellerius zeteki TaxID=64791 RepID=A0A151X3T7_9HYME|nr:hypothetical protein ALC60_06099 [Trachymyrmex zeteki]